MTHSIHISDHAAQRLAQLQAMTGHSAAQIIDWALEDRLAHQERDGVQAAIAQGADQADRGEFSSRSVEQIFAEAIARAKANLPLES